MLQYLVVILNLLYVSANCPCRPAENLFNNNTVVNICLHKYDIQPFSYRGVHIVHIIEDSSQVVSSHNCSVVISSSHVNMETLQQSRQLCPENCSPIPTVTVPTNILDALNNTDNSIYHDFSVTCSLTLSMVNRSYRNVASNSLSLREFFIVQVAKRLILECKEHPTFSTNNSSLYTDYSKVSRRKVKGVVIWVGSYSNIKLIQQQAVMLSEAPHHGTSAVVGWAATDEVYGCTKEETKCIGHNGRYKFLPNTNINYMSTGWGCAQRRPLRALAHVLKLFDPQFIISLDDDSYCNYPLLMERYGSFITGKYMHSQPLFMGEYTGKTGPQGQLTTQGLFVGGAGYILGHKLLSRLVRKEIHSYGYETWPGHRLDSAKEKAALVKGADVYRTEAHIKYLSVLTEGMELAAENCPAQSASRSLSDSSTDHNSCVLSATPRPSRSTRHSSSSHSAVLGEDGLHSGGRKKHTEEQDHQVVPLAVRLIDFCVNIMAGAHTCQHRSVALLLFHMCS